MSSLPPSLQVVFGAMGVNMETARFFRTSFEESGAMQVGERVVLGGEGVGRGRGRAPCR